MNKMVKVNFRNIITKEFPINTTLLEVSKYFSKYFNYPILVAKTNNEITGLSEALKEDSDVDFFDLSSSLGNSVYGRSVQYILILAVRKVLGKEAEIRIENSLDKGIYCEISGVELDKPILNKIENKMREIVKEDKIFTKVSVERLSAIDYFKKANQEDKVKVLKYISNSSITLYRLDELYDYFHGEMAHSTKDIHDFTLSYIEKNGFVLSYPTPYNPEFTLDYIHRPMIYQAFIDYSNWGRVLGISNAADLNEFVSTGKYDNLIRLAEVHFNNQLAKIAAQINQNKTNIKMVLIAGPSSSGKTTTSKKLEVYLQSYGLKTHQISIDDYFVNRVDTPKDEDGEYDFESMRAIDVTLFNQHLSQLIAGERVLMPEYNFVTGEREYRGKELQIGEQDILIIEGLHGLNEDLTMAVERINKFKIYISPLTQLNIDNHNRIHTSDTRKLRRIIRDNKSRGWNASETLGMWKKIREGEEKYIFPYQDEADALINSAFIYELGVLKTYAEPLLFSVEEDDPNYHEAIRLINFLRNFLPIPSDNIPSDSILREFIGGSSFENKK